MEGVNGVNGRRTRMNSSSREVSPDRARAMMMQQPRFGRGNNAKRVQIVYYLSRNGQLEHPHFMELPQLPNQQIRLKDFIDRLTALRGKGMPALYSWSCKRNYKNGYVWNDLSENDVIYPSDGAEYVLKGSEIIPGCSERFHHLPISNRFTPKPLSMPHKPYIEPEDEHNETHTYDTDLLSHHEYHTNTATNNRHAPHTPTLRMTSKKPQANHIRQIELPLEEDASPPSSSSSDKHLTDPSPTRPNSSVFLQLIACGAGAVGANKGSARKSSCGLQRGLVSRLSAGRIGLDDHESDRVSRSERFGSLSVEDKEYFSGSIVEARRPAVNEPALKRSNSYNEDRMTRIGIGEQQREAAEGATGEEEEEDQQQQQQGRAADGIKGKCIPTRSKKNSAAKLHQPHHKQHPIPSPN